LPRTNVQEKCVNAWGEDDQITENECVFPILGLQFLELICTGGECG
jgi:hypothetical protein